MININGNLSIRTINGRNGPFNVGKLVTELGEFSVKDVLLEQYEEGMYQGDFGISRIYPAHYIAGNRLIIEIRATLETMALAGIDDYDEVPAVEPDPIEEEKQQAAVAKAAEAEPESLSNKMDDSGNDESQDRQLFGAVWPLDERVKLDPTVDRSLFRQQRDRLKTLGYKFEPLGQVWIKGEGHN